MTMNVPDRKFTFLSSEWVTAVRGVLVDLLTGADLTGIDFTISEEVTDPPADRGNRPLGWYLRIRGGHLIVGDTAIADADFRLIADYHTHHELARRVWAGNESAMAESRVLREQAVAEGKLKTKGDFTSAPDIVRDLIIRLHDPVALLTE